MPILSDEAQKIILPKMYCLRQKFSEEKIADIENSLLTELEKLNTKLFPGASVAIAVGSRGIQNLHIIVQLLISRIKAMGGLPFIVAAMGSHGGGTEFGQKSILASYGITEEQMGVRIDCSMETKKINETSRGVPVYTACSVLSADFIFLVARIKPHTDFRGTVESGLCKMLAIGLGKHNGCARLHREGFENFPSLIPEVANLILKKIKTCFGIAIIENGYDQTSQIELIPSNLFMVREPILLELAKHNMPKIYFTHCDVLIVDTIGKDISGAGMDPNIIGRTTKGILEGYTGPTISRIIVQNISKFSHGNAIGIGLSDFCIESLLSSIDYESTYANSIASGNPESGKIPPALPNLETAVKAALSCTPSAVNGKSRIIKIKNTLELDYIWVSESMLEEAIKHESIEVINGEVKRLGDFCD